jgi:excisionase family DNA binding protein
MLQTAPMQQKQHGQRSRSQIMQQESAAFELLTAGDIARYCGVTSSTVSRWIRGNKLRAYTTPGGHYRIQKRDFKEFLETSGLPIDKQYFSGDIDLESEGEHGKDSGRG